MREISALFLICVVLMTMLCGCGNPPSSEVDLKSHGRNSGPNKRLDEAQLKLNLAETSPLGAAFAERELVLKVINGGKGDVLLDRRLLTIQLVKLLDLKGNQIPSPPPHLIRPFNQEKDVLILQPSQSFEVVFKIAQLTVLRLSDPSYVIVCCYDGSQVKYPPETGMWNGVACSENFELK